MKRLSILAGSTLLLLSMVAPLPLTAQPTGRRTSPGQLAATAVESDDAPLPRLGPFTWRRQIVRIGGTYTFGVDDAARDLVLIGADATIEGRVDGDVVVVFGNTRLASTAVIDGSLTVVGGHASADSSARVWRDLVVVGGTFDAPAEFAPGGDHFVLDARALGGHLQDIVTWLTHGLLWGRLIVPSLPWIWPIVGVLFFVYLALNVIFDRPIRSSTATLVERPLRSFIVGLLVMLLAAPVLLLLGASVIGIPVVPVVLCALLIAMIVGRAATARWIGMGLVRQETPDSRGESIRSFVIGFAIVCIAYMIPVLGIATWAMLSVLGMGAAALAFVGEYRKENPAPVRPPRVRAAEPEIVTISNGGPAMPSVNADAVAMDEAPRPIPVSAGDLLSMPHAYFRDRIAASVLDIILVLFVGRLLDEWFRENTVVLLMLTYAVGFWAWKGATVGGIICQLRVVKVDGSRLTFAESLVRGLSAMFSVLVLGLGFLWILRDPDRQAWHDRIAGTYVVKVPRNWPI